MKNPLAVLLVVGLVALVAAALWLFRDSDDPIDAAVDAESDRVAAEGAESGRIDGGSDERDEPFTMERVLVPPVTTENGARTAIRGIAYDPDGTAMSSVIVAFEQSSGERERFLLQVAVETDDGGSYGIDLSAGEYRISAHLPTQQRGHDLWFAPETIVVPPEGEMVRDIRFVRPRSTICGTITTGLGIPFDVGVALCATSGKHLRRTSTDAAGYYAIDGVAPGTYRFFIEKGSSVGKILLPWRASTARERSAERWPAVTVSAGDEIVRHDITLAEPVTASLRVSLPGQEEFFEGGTVFVREAVGPADSVGSSRLGQHRVYAFPVDSEGKTAAKVLYPGDYVAFFWGVPDGTARPDPVRMAIPLTPAEQTVDVAFVGAAGGGCVEGRVVDQSGKPIARARVQLWDGAAAARIGSLSNTCARAEAVCDDEGAFRITGLNPGRYVVRRDRRPISNTGPLLIDRREDLSVAIGEESSGAVVSITLEVHAAPRTSLKGRIDGVAVSIPLHVKATVQPAAVFEESHFWTKVDREGAFVFQLLPKTDTPVKLEVLADMGPSRRAVFARTIAPFPENEAQAILIERFSKSVIESE